MLRTRVCDLFGVEHPIVLGGMGSGTSPALVTAVSSVQEAERAAESGADAIAAQGTEGGGHVWLMGTMVLVRHVVKTVAPLPVLAAGGIADGAGLAASLMLGAEGALLGTRFLATP